MAKKNKLYNNIIPVCQIKSLLVLVFVRESLTIKIAGLTYPGHPESVFGIRKRLKEIVRVYRFNNYKPS